MDKSRREAAVFHIENVEDVGFLLRKSDVRGVEIGMAIGVNTSNKELEKWLDKIDYVQFMGIAKIGSQGQPFDNRVLRKIKDFRKTHPNVIIQVDGGVNATNAPLLIEAGVDRLVVGSAIEEFINV